MAPTPSGESTGEWRVGGHDDEVTESGGDRDDVKPGSAGHADHGHDPDDRGGGEAADDAVIADEDEPAADETDAGDDLGGDPGRVERHAMHLDPVVGAVLRDDHRHAGAQTDQSVGAEAGALLAVLALQPDRRTQAKGQRQPHQQVQL